MNKDSGNNVVKDINRIVVVCTFKMCLNTVTDHGHICLSVRDGAHRESLLETFFKNILIFWKLEMKLLPYK